jgi:TolA-binding protein
MRASSSVKAVASLLFLLVVAMATPGCGGPLSQADHQLFLDAHRNFQSGNYAAADAKFTQVIGRNQSSDALSELCYFRGLTRLKQGRRAEAREDFRRGATARGRELTQVYSAVALANLDFDDGNDASAANLYSQALDHQVKDLQTDAILYRLAVSLQRLGRWDEADRRLAKLLSDYDDSPFAAAARRRFQATHFAIQAGAFASRSNADTQAAKIRTEGYPVTVTVSEGGGKVLHVVTVGRFRTYAEASSAATRLRGRGYTVTIKP